jgi:CBS domain-containing protein
MNGVQDPVPAGDLSEIAVFVRQSPPFYELDSAALEFLVSALHISYHRQGERFSKDSVPGGLRILRSGAVDIRDDDGALLDRLGEGESFHIGGLNAERGNVEANVEAIVIEDTLLYLLPDVAYQEMRTRNRKVDRYFSGQRSRRLRRAARYEPQPHSMMREVHTVMSSDPLTVRPGQAVQQVARQMSERRVSSAFITEGDKLLGIVTDRDLRDRVVANALPHSAPVSEIMTGNLETVSRSDTLFGCMLIMTQRNYHHLPVVADGKLCGIVTTSDLILARQDDPVYLVQHISRQSSVAGLKELVSGLSNLMVQWVNSGMRAQQVSRILTAVSDAVTVRLIQLAEEKLGGAPAPYCWVGFGSQARAEQLLGADQDNGLILADSVQEQDLEWFQAMARFVCDGLNSCGYVYCSGDVMASNQEWRQPLREWLDYVNRWTRSPTPDAVMRVSIFFDLRAIHGEKNLCDSLQTGMLEKASSNTIFQAALAANALEATPPLGIFRRFVVDRNGEHRESMDLKKRGILLLTDTIRLHALAHGIVAVNTEERLQALAQGKHMTIGDSRNLSDALRFMQQLRIQHQVRQITEGAAPDNFLNPGDLPRLSREQLRDAFTIVSDSQAALRQAYRQGMG